MAWEFSFHFAGSLESPLAPSSEAYHPSSTYFHQECQWFFDPPPARQLILKISTAHKMSKSFKTFSISTLCSSRLDECTKASFLSEEDWISKITKVLLCARGRAAPRWWRKAQSIWRSNYNSAFNANFAKEEKTFHLCFAFQRNISYFNLCINHLGSFWRFKNVQKCLDRLSDSRLRDSLAFD